MRTKVAVAELKGFTEEQQAKLKTGAMVLEYTINLSEFKERVLNFSYRDGLKTVKAFRMNQGLSNEDLYQFIMEGSEKSSPGKDREFDICVELYNSVDDVLGYTYSASRWQHINNKFFQKMTWAGIASNMMHEYLHRLGSGFTHEQEYTKQREYTVPYAVGYIVKDLASTL